MFCTKCGKELYPGDKFCAHCGTETRIKAASRYDDIVFNPPFKQEAKKKTEEIVGFVTSREPEPVKKTEKVNFDWGMERPEQKRPQETVFDWSQVLEQKSRQRKIEVEKLGIAEDRRFFVEKEKKPEVTVVGFAQPASTIICEIEEEPLSIEDLEREIFGEIETKSHMAEEVKASSGADTDDDEDIKVTQKEKEMAEADSPDEQPSEEEPAEEETYSENSAEEKPSEGENKEENNVFMIADESGEIITDPEEIEIESEEKTDATEKNALDDYVVVDPEDVKAFGDEKFYTYNQKCGAFDELLQKEKERLDNISNGAYVFDEREDDGVDEADPDQESMDINIAEMPQIVDAESEYLANFPPEKTISVDPIGKFNSNNEGNPNRRDDFKAAFMQEAEEKTAESKESKLRYSDVFPRTPVDEKGNPIPGYEEPKMVVRHDPVVPQIIAQNKARQAEERKKQESQQQYNKRPEKTETELKDLTGIFDSMELEEDKPKKKHIFSKIIITLLVLLLIAEGVVLGTKLVAPDSPFSIWINEKALGAVEYIFEKFNPQEETPEVDSTADDHMSLLVSEASAKSKKIGEISYDRELKFSIMPDFVFPEVAEASDFIDEEWYADEDGNMLTYGQVLMEAIVKYYDKWNKINEDDNLVGINVLEIGETRTVSEGFYTLARLSLATADGGQEVKYQTVFTGISDKSIVINMVKEETINEGQ